MKMDYIDVAQSTPLAEHHEGARFVVGLVYALLFSIPFWVIAGLVAL